MKRVKKILKGRYSRKVIIYLLMCCLVLNTSLPALLAAPAGGVPDLRDGGGVSITYRTGPNFHTTLVNVDTTRTIINWESLDTRGGAPEMRETLAFTQTGMYGNTVLTNSAVLNRISGSATQFNGDLVAPGMRIFMVNPAGIIFGEGSTINVSQLVASGLNMTNDAFKEILENPGGQMVFSGGNGAVENYGTINANKIIMVGDKVINLGSIVSSEGLVVMAAGDKVYLGQGGSEVIVELIEDPLNTIDDIQNGGSIIADNGKIILAAGDTFSRAVSNVGTLAAAGGEVTIQASNVKNKGLINVSSDTSGGSVALTGTEEVLMGTGGIIEANAGDNVDGGDGGNVTIQTDGLFRMDEGSSITAVGGSVSGKGGSVTINCDKFEILGDISASPVNEIEEPGKLEINTLTDVIIADGASTGATNTLYEDDIEAISQSATNLIVNTEGNITVQNITDDWGPGEITGQFGDIELHATGDDSAVTFTFEDNTDTIRTTLGDIVIEAGSGGINVGNLTTGDISDEKPTPGQILLSTNNGGDITTGDLLIRTGSGLAKIDVDSSGNLTVNGDVIVGSESDILNVINGQNAHAAVYLSAADNIELKGNVGAYAQGVDDDITEGDITMAEIRILAGTDEDLTGDAFIGGDVVADAQSSNQGTAEAIVEIDAWGTIEFADGAEAHAIADNGDAVAVGTEDDEKFSNEDPPDHAQIIINPQYYPTPPLKGIADEFSTPKSDVILVDVLANDMQNGETITDGTIYSFTEPIAGTVTPTMSGDRIVGLTYNPPEDFSTVTFDENGEATVTFTYVGKLVIEDEQLLSEPTTVTITLINELPVAVTDSAKTIQDQAININVITNDTDSDLVDVLTAIEGAVAPKNGTLVLNEDGTFAYTPDKGFVGDDSFTYSVTDGFNTSSEVEVKITVTTIPEEPPVPLSTLVLPYIYPAPGLDGIAPIGVEISGCPALAKWVAEELGVGEGMINIWMANSMASTKGIQPYDTYSKLIKAALILKDADGSHINALVQVMNEFASSAAPPTEEQMAAIVNAIKGNTDADSYYAIANEYLDALVTYIGILSTEMGFSTMESVQFVTDKYIGRLPQDQNAGVASFLAACLAVLEG